MDLAKLRLIAGISDKSTSVDIEAFRVKMNEQLDQLSIDAEHGRLDEGLFTNLRALFDLSNTTSKAVAKKALQVGGEALKKAQVAFKDAHMRQCLIKFEKEISKLEEAFGKFETDPDLTSVLNKDPKMVELFKSVAAVMKSINEQAVVLRSDAVEPE